MMNDIEIKKTTEEKLMDEFTGQMVAIRYDADIIADGKKIGTVDVYENYDEEGEAKSTYISDITIAEQHRCNGYGEATLRKLSAQYGGIYLCPENERCEHLYERIGEEVSRIPEELEGNYDEWGKMYYI